MLHPKESHILEHDSCAGLFQPRVRIQHLLTNASAHCACRVLRYGQAHTDLSFNIMRELLKYLAATNTHWHDYHQ